ncbi:MAG: nucleotide pyrophosphohydrolase [Clostridia bacterium]|nr:nucleotide pyrophosphohydrolase [Clostridia bacterium]
MAMDFGDMQQIQRELQEKYQQKWGGLSPEKGRQLLLWMLCEAGEAAQLIKHKGDNAIMEEPAVRQAFIEELCDVMMYFNDVCLCYDIKPEVIEKVYHAKHERNMHRW